MLQLDAQIEMPFYRPTSLFNLEAIFRIDHFPVYDCRGNEAVKVHLVHVKQEIKFSLSLFS